MKLNAILFVNCFQLYTLALYCSMRCVIIVPLNQYDDDVKMMMV